MRSMLMVGQQTCKCDSLASCCYSAYDCDIVFAFGAQSVKHLRSSRDLDVPAITAHRCDHVWVSLLGHKIRLTIAEDHERDLVLITRMRSVARCTYRV